MREDYETLSKGLALSDDELRTLGLLAPATGTPAELAEVYIRRSAKREDVASLREQLRDVVRTCQEHELAVRHVWFEQLSASKRSVTRREYAKALQAVLDGRSKTLVVWKLDRFDRKGAGSVMSAIDKLDERRCRLITYVERLDSSAQGVRMLISIFAERAKSEAEDIALRVQNGHKAHKALGRRGTGRPPYGLYSAPGSGTVEPHPTEYETARSMAKMMLDGTSALAVAHWANDRGLTTRSGKPWTFMGVSRLMQSPVFAGMVPQRERERDEYGNYLDSWRTQGEPVYRDDGTPLMCGTGVVTPAEYFKIRALIRQRVNPATGKGRKSGTYLATGLLRCGICNGPEIGGAGGKYRCVTRQQSGPSVCMGTMAMASRVDTALTEMWLAHVRTMEPDSEELYEIGKRLMRFSDPQTAEQSVLLSESLASAESRLQELSDRYWNPPTGGYRMPESDFERQSSRLGKTVEDLRVRIDAVTARADISALLEPDLLAASWEQADLAMRRTLLSVVWPNGVLLLPAVRRGDRSPIQVRLRVFVIPNDENSGS